MPALAALLFILASCGTNAGQNNQVSIVSAVATSKTSILVTFNRAVGEGANTTSNYTIAAPGGERLEVVAAYPGSDGTTVMLATAVQQPITYVLTAANIQAADGQNAAQLEVTGSFGGSGESAPIVASAIALSTTQVLVTFADPSNGQPATMSASAADKRYYEMSDPDLKINSIAQVAGNTAVILTTVEQKAQNYTIKVTNVTSSSGNKLVDPFNSTVSFRGISANDTEGPSVKSVAVLSLTSLLVTFTEPVRETAADPSHYLIFQSENDAQTLAITEAVLNEFGAQVTLTTYPQAEGVEYTLEVSDLLDLKGNLMDPNPSSAGFVGGRKLGPVESDTTPPRVANVGSTSNTSVKVTFSEPVLEGAENIENYRITANSLGGNLSTQSVLIVTGASLSDAGTTVTLATMPQSDIEYTLSVVDVKDLAGNQIAPPQLGVPTPSSLRFVGTAADGKGVDTDGDGLSDAAEQRGWVINLKLLDGSVVQREVTSSPRSPDTDEDGIGDFDEKNYGADPRTEDPDDDGLTDNEELSLVYTNPDDQDTDDDGLADGLEFEFFKTSPLLVDTDGDQFLDGDEVALDNRNPRVADLPIVEVEVGNVDLRLDVRFEGQTSQGTTTIDSRSVATTLTQAQEQSLTKENSSTLEWFVNAGASFCIAGGCPSGGDFAGNLGAEFKVEGGASGSSTSTFTTESSQATQKEYATSLSTDREVSAESVVTRIVEGATMAAAVNLRNASNIAFTISDLEITALVQDPRDPTIFVPVATLFAASDSPIGIGPLTPVRGPFRFVAQEAFPQLVESLMKNPRGLIFRVANFEIEDEFGRKFAFVEQDINDRTAFLEIDYAGNLDLERYRAATNAGFDALGKTTGLSMHQIMQDVLGLTFVPEAEDVDLTPNTRDNADLIDSSYSTRTVGNVEKLYRVKSVSPKLLNDADRLWWVITPNGYDPNLSFSDIQVFSDQEFAFKFVQDADADLLEAAQEAMYRSNDNNADTDGDGLGDADEVFGYLGANRRTGWTIQLQDGQDAQRTFSNPSRADTDLDGLTDCQELAPLTKSGDCNTTITVYRDADGVPTLKAKGIGGQANTFVTTLKLTKATDPSSPDTDNDGLPDLQEVIGFIYTDLSGQPKTLVATSTSTATNPLSRDTDTDGLADFQEILLGTNPSVSDGDTVLDDDGDGLVNLRETTGWDVTFVDGLGLRTVRDTSDPKKPDSDGDGLTDWEEYTGCRDRNRDLICDTEDRFGSTRPRFADTDADGLTDRQEVDSVAFSGDSDKPYRFTNPRDIDMDDDGRSDGAEILESWTVLVVGKGGRVVYSDPLDADKDRDGLTDASEKLLGSDPNSADTDGDGALDGLENTRITNILQPDHLVTVFYRGLQAGGQGNTGADIDCDDGSNPGDFYFYFQVGRPTASGALSFDTVVASSSVSVRTCENGDDGGPCRNGDGQIQLASPQKLYMNESTSFAVPLTDLFTIEGLVQEIDDGADLSYFFGGIGTPNGSYKGSQLELGAFDVAFNDPPLAVGNKTCDVEVTVQVKVE